MLNTIREEIIRELEARGYNASAQNKIVNGIEKIGVSFNNGNTNIGTVFYVNDLVDRFTSISDAVDYIIKGYHNESNIRMSDIAKVKDKLADAEYVKANTYIMLQGSVPVGFISRETQYPGIYQYMYINLDVGIEDKLMVRVTPDVVKVVEIVEEELWKCATENTRRETHAEMTPFGMVIITGKNMNYGASGVLFKENIESAAKMMGKDVSELILIPSSVHEIIVFSDEDITMDEINEFISQANSDTNVVSPEEVLYDKAFRAA